MGRALSGTNRLCMREWTMRATEGDKVGILARDNEALKNKTMDSLRQTEAQEIVEAFLNLINFRVGDPGYDIGGASKLYGILVANLYAINAI